MILHLSPDAPLVARFAADAALAGHIGGGTLGVGAGFVALLARKGERLHRAAGNVFFAAMLVAYGVGGAVAPLIRQPANTIAAAFALYLLVTAWGAAKRPAGQVGRFEIGALAAAAATAVGLVGYAWAGALNPRLLAGVPWQVPLTLSLFAVLTAALDLGVVRQGGLVGAARIRRHLWRMCFAMFFGTGSLFLGQPKVFPPFLRGSPILWVLALAPLAAMAFWLVRTRAGRGAAKAPPLTPVQEALS